MAQKAAGRLANAFLLLFMLTLSCSAPSLAQPQGSDKVFGDWKVYEDKYGSKGPTGVPDTAATPALNGRTAEMRFDCSAYQVHFYLYPDGAFQGALPEVAYDDIVFTRVDREEPFPSRRMLLIRTESASSFDAYVEELMRSSTYMICPKANGKDPACLTFSLRGFTAALKAICPKR